MFLQIHFLTSYHGSLLNRDDAGLAKRLSFGGIPRLRVSSQSQKRHWREYMMSRTDLPSALRSRRFFRTQVQDALVAEGMAADVAHALTFQLAEGVLHAGKGKTAVNPDTLDMEQPLLFGRPEAEYFRNLIRAAAATETPADVLGARIEEATKARNFGALVRQAGYGDAPAGFEGAMFGRFITSDLNARVDAPVHVAHAFTTHELDAEVDFFTVVDDLAGDEETGAAHANDMELGAGIFYGYVVVDVPLLVSNLTGCDRQQWQQEDTRAAQALLALLIQAIAEVSPGAKLGATAPYARAECVVLEVGPDQPRSLANAFLAPVRQGHRASQPMAQSVVAMGQYLDGLTNMYGPSDVRRWVSSIHPWPHAADTVLPLPTAIGQSLTTLFAASVDQRS